MKPSSLRSTCVYFDLTYASNGLPSIKLLKFIEPIPPSGGVNETTRYRFVDCSKDLGVFMVGRIRELGEVPKDWDPNHGKDITLSEADLAPLIDITTLFKKLGIKRGSNS